MIKSSSAPAIPIEHATTFNMPSKGIFGKQQKHVCIAVLVYTSPGRP